MRLNPAANALLVLVCAAAPWPARVAHAEETVEAFVARYELALDRGDPDLLRAVYEDWSLEKEAKLRTYFAETVREFNVELSDVEVVESDEARARIRFVRRDRFTDARSGQRVEKQVQLDRTLHRSGGLWKLAPVTESHWQ